jgi:Cdc6-like AAA superfamily ATPase
MTHPVSEVFTPTTPATLTFVERDESTSRRIERALQTPGMQLVIYGPTGTGKTTLLRNKLEQFGPEQTITCRCTSTTTFHDILASAFSKLGATYTAERTEGGGSRTAQIGGSVLGTGANLGIAGSQKPSSTERAVAEVPVSVEQLGQYLGQANADLVIEDLHKAPEKTKAAVAEAMKLFMDLCAEFPNLKIIALGARETAEDILRFDGEMKNRVAEVGVDPMTSTELKEILAKGGDCWLAD